MRFDVELTDSYCWTDKGFVENYKPEPVEINTIEELRDYVLKANNTYHLFEPNTVVITFSGNDIPTTNRIEIYNEYRE